MGHPIQERIEADLAEKGITAEFFLKNPRRLYLKVDPEDLVETSRAIFEMPGVRYQTATGQQTATGFEVLHHFAFDYDNCVVSVRVFTAEDPPVFSATLVSRNGSRADLAGKDDVEAVLADLGWRVTGERPAEQGNGNAVIEIDIAPADGETTPFRVSSVRSREKKKNPAPPFITSKLQQDAARSLGFPVAKTMRLMLNLGPSFWVPRLI